MMVATAVRYQVEPANLNISLVRTTTTFIFRAYQNDVMSPYPARPRAFVRRPGVVALVAVAVRVIERLFRAN